MSSNPIYSFSKVKRAQCKASILIEGLSGRGKSGLALILAQALTKNWEKVFALDTENNSLKLFDGIACSAGGTFKDFQVADFSPDIGYSPSHYLAFREAAIQAGAEVLIQDSITHCWSYKGGVLDILAEKKKSNTRYQKDSYAAWGDEDVVREKNLLYQLFRDSRCHIISTVRVKEKMEYDKDDNGKTVLVSLGEQQIMQNDVKYEPDLVIQMIQPGSAKTHPIGKISKSRYAILEVGQTYEFTPQLCDQIAEYLNQGTSPEILLEQQRQEYIEGVTAYLNSHPNARALWAQIKKDAGFGEVALKDMPLQNIKELFVKLTID